MSIALELGRAGRRVLMLESGDATHVRAELSNAVNYGHLPGGWWNRHSIRAFGGTSNVWGGWCATLRASDFTRPIASATP